MCSASIFQETGPVVWELPFETQGVSFNKQLCICAFFYWISMWQLCTWVLPWAFSCLLLVLFWDWGNGGWRGNVPGEVLACCISSSPLYASDWFNQGWQSWQYDLHLRDCLSSSAWAAFEEGCFLHSRNAHVQCVSSHSLTPTDSPPLNMLSLWGR